MNEEFRITTDLDINTIPEYSTVDGIRYFEDKVKNISELKSEIQRTETRG